MIKQNSLTKVSIITVCYNSANTIEKAIESVINQCYGNVEYIIIDGGSTDGTVDIIKKYKDKIAYWHSKTDKGIYNAMNIGVQKATGEYVYFLGADDSLIDCYIIEKVANYILDHLDGEIFCGQVLAIDKTIKLEKIQGKKLTLNDILSGNIAPHQGMFVKRILLKNQSFNEKYKIAADYEFFVKSQLNNVKTYYLDYAIAYYCVNGVSSLPDVLDEYLEIISIYSSLYHYTIFNKKKTRIKYTNKLKSFLKWCGLFKFLRYSQGWKKHNCNNQYCCLCMKK